MCKIRYSCRTKAIGTKGNFSTSFLLLKFRRIYINNLISYRPLNNLRPWVVGIFTLSVSHFYLHYYKFYSSDWIRKPFLFNLLMLWCIYRCTLRIGHGEKTTIEAGNNLFSGEWHTVVVQRRRRITNLKVDSLSPATKILAGPSLGNIHLNRYIFVGGMVDVAKKNLGINAPHFRGCLADLRFDSIDILKGAQRALARLPRNTPYDVYGHIPFKCLLEDLRPVTFKTPQSFIKVSLPKRPYENDSFTVSFKFRTFYPYGLLFSRSAIKVKMKIRLQDGTLIYEVMPHNGSKFHIIMGRHLNDGEWHDVTTLISTDKVSLTVDGHTRSRILNMSSLLVRFSNQSRMKVFAGRGGSQSKFPGFVGCMANLKIDDVNIALKFMIKPRFSHRVDGTKCSLRDKCSPNPCLNGGTCRQDWKKFYCNCLDTYFKGPTCDVPFFKSTCEDYRLLGLTRDSHCLLHTGTSNAKDRFTGLCIVTDPRRAYTVIKHNLERTSSVIRAQDGELINEQYYVHKVNYHNIKESTIAALIRHSKVCRQYIRLNCVNSKLMSSNSSNLVFWKSLNYHKYTNWDNVFKNSRICACQGSNASQCTVNQIKSDCNCDNQGTIWIGGEGYLDIKHQLPVTKIVFNKTTAMVNSSLQLGPLECWGKSVKEATQPKADTYLVEQACYPVFDLQVSPSLSTKMTTVAVVTAKICRDSESCFNPAFPTDPTGPIKWTNPTTIETSETEESSNDGVDVQSQESNKNSQLRAPTLLIIIWVSLVNTPLIQ